MDKDIFRMLKYFSIIMIGFIVLFPTAIPAAETTQISIDAAKSAIEQAQRAGADRPASEDFSAAKSWLAQAEKAYAAANSIMAMISTPKTKREKEEEIVYLATMAKIKGLTAEATAKNVTTSAKLAETKKDLSDYQGAIVVMKDKQKQAELAKEVQAKAEIERKQLVNSQKAAEEIEAQKRKELLEAQRKTAELEAMKQREIQTAKLKEAEREKEAAQAKLKDVQMGAQRAKEVMEIKAGEEKLSAEKVKLAAMQAKLQSLEKEKAMLTAAGQIPKVTAVAGEKKIIMTILAINLFTPANEISPAGKEVLNSVAGFLKAYPDNKVVAQGHTDSSGKQANNQMLSEKRAQKVREYLVASQNIAPTRIAAEGVGSAEPVSTNANEAGRALNRRVELTILTGEP